MANDDLIKSIVSQVIEKLTADGATSPAGGAGRGMGGGMGSGARRPLSISPAPSPAQRGGPCALVVLTAGDAATDEVYRQLSQLAERNSGLVVYLSPSARKVLDLPAIRRSCPSAELLGAEVTHELRDLVEKCDAVYLPTLTLSTASKIAFLNGDTAASLMPIYALSRGKTVVAASNSVYGLRRDLPPAPEGFRRRVDKIFNNLSELGVRVVDVGQLASASAAAPTAASAPARPAVPGFPAATPTFSSAPGGSSGNGCATHSGDCEACGQCAEKNEEGVRSLVANGAQRIGATSGTRVTDKGLAGLIDHTLLKADATEADIRKLCEEARQYVFASVCVNPTNVALAARLLEGSPVKVCTVIGFPLGATTPTAKAIETRDAIANGATEIDMVINVGALKSGDDDLVRRDIAGVVEAARGQAIVKVILETALLSAEEKVKACLLSKMAGADFVKTSTGFSTGGATAEDIALMRETVGPDMGVKASGGIKNADDVKKMVAAGATRIGASASVAIARGETSASGGY